ncbi:MAG: hypothetical protein ABH873_00970 [Candidatus Firestonebacteria bacterium]
MKKIVVCMLGLSLVLMSCSNRPALTKAEEVQSNEAAALIETAKADIESAKKAGVEKYANEMVLSAESSLKTAESTIELKDFVKAKELAQKASLEAKTAISLPNDAKNAILEAEVEVNKAKESKSDEEAPNEFKSANELLESAKGAIGKDDYKIALEFARSSIDLSRKSIEEPAVVKALVLQLEDNLKMAKDLQVDQLSADVYKSASDGLEGAKVSLSSHDNAKAKELAEKSSNDIKEEMKKVVNLVIEQAKVDLSSAKEAGASEFSADLLVIAEENMSSATSLLEKGDYVNAKVSAEKVSSTSKEATTKAQVGKEAKTISEGGTIAEVPVITPEATTTSESTTAIVSSTPTTETSTQQVVTSSTEKPIEHTVLKGEYLWKISGYEIIYYDSLQWPIIYHANTDQIKDPNLIYPKQILRIPRDLTEKQVKGARKEASAITSKSSSSGTKIDKTEMEDKKSEESNLSATSSQSEGPSFPVIPIVIISGVIIVIFVVRTIRKKVTASVSS